VSILAYRQKNQTLNQETSRSYLMPIPFIKYIPRWIGIGGGLHLGNLVYTTGDTTGDHGFRRMFHRTPIFPQFYFPCWGKKVFYVIFTWQISSRCQPPGMVFQAGFGKRLWAEQWDEPAIWRNLRFKPAPYILQWPLRFQPIWLSEWPHYGTIVSMDSEWRQERLFL